MSDTAEHLESCPDSVARERKITGREWWLFDGEILVLCVDGAWSLAEQGCEFVDTDANDPDEATRNCPISETAAIAWMAEHDVEWPESMGARCYARKDPLPPPAR